MLVLIKTIFKVGPFLLNDFGSAKRVNVKEQHSSCGEIFPSSVRSESKADRDRCCGRKPRQHNRFQKRRVF